MNIRFLAKFALVACLGTVAMFGWSKPVSSHGYSVGNFALELDGVVVGRISGVEGGQAEQDVAAAELGSGHIHEKHLGAIKYSEISLRCGTEMSPKFYDWIKSEVAGDFTKHNGAIVVANANNRITQRLEFQNALISEVEFPKLDGSSRESVHFYIKISPQLTKFAKISNGPALPGAQSRPKIWLSNDFKLTILGKDCTHVSEVDSLVIKEKIVDSGGAVRNAGDGSSGELKYPDLVFRISDIAATPFKKMLIDNETNPTTTQGKLDFFGPNEQLLYFSLSFSKLGLLKVTPMGSTSGADSLKRDEIKMTCDKMQFSYQNAVLGIARLLSMPFA